MTNFFNKVMAACKAMASKKEIAEKTIKIDAELSILQAREKELLDKRNALFGKSEVKKEASESGNKAKGKAQVSCAKDDLLVNVSANVQVKDICRNIERKLQRNLSSKSDDDKQLLYNHLFYFYSLKHINTLPEVIGKNKTYHINDYVAMRVNSVINDITCHINFK